MRFLIICFAFPLLMSCNSHHRKVSFVVPPCDYFLNIDTTEGHADGCSGAFLYKKIDTAKYLVICFNKNKIHLTDSCMQLDIAQDSDKVQVWVDSFKKDTMYVTNYCTDRILLGLSKPKRFTAIKGKVICSKKEGVNAILNDVVLKDQSSNDTIFISKELFYNVDVSNTPG